MTRHLNNIFLVLLFLGKWCPVERFDVPEEYVQLLLEREKTLMSTRMERQYQSHALSNL